MVKKFLISKTSTIREAMAVIDRNKEGIALVVDEDGRLIGTITDGDIRRFLIANRSIEECAEVIMGNSPLSAPITATKEEIKDLMKKNRIRSVPLVDKIGRPKKLISIRALIENDDCETIAVIMAGGEGKRLRPLTEKTPKPMLDVGGKPLLENIINTLAVSKVSKIYIAVNYKAETIENYFKDGKKFNVKIEYLKETKKLGTAGALALLPEAPSSPFIVINGDIMSHINIERLLEYHFDHRCAMTIGAVKYRVNVPFGVLQLSKHYVLEIQEKPEQNFLCNGGIYAINPEVLQFVPNNEFFNMTDLCEKILSVGWPVGAFPIYENWIDIGKIEDLKIARRDASVNSSESAQTN